MQNSGQAGQGISGYIYQPVNANFVICLRALVYGVTITLAWQMAWANGMGKRYGKQHGKRDGMTIGMANGEKLFFYSPRWRKKLFSSQDRWSFLHSQKEKSW